MQFNLFDIDSKTPNTYDILLVDGNHLLHRAMGSYSGLGFVDEQRSVYIPTGAIYGFFKLLTSTHRKWGEPTGCKVVVCWEGGNLKRKEWYPQYKGNRKLDKSKLSEEELASKELYKQEMFTQLRVIEKMIKLSGITYCNAPGWEADDVMGSLAKMYSTQDPQCRVCIYTGDGDLHQCVTDKVHVISGGSGRGGDTVYTVDSVKEKWGCIPTMIPQLKGLAGDSGDNIPGCPSCGQKTASLLLETHNSLENLLEQASKGDIGKVRNGKKIMKNLVEQKELVLISHKLAVINVDLDVDLHTDKVDVGKVQTLLDYFRIQNIVGQELILK